ncbi:hypothetical protein KW785_01390 [Candidatus Parcubacteria bacterium]|nr:hypothetical protein [Candidatus Parcubacteria bacterium]
MELLQRKSLISPIGHLSVRAQPSFIVPDCTSEPTLPLLSPKIYYADAEFGEWFSGKVEGPVGEAELSIYRLNSPASPKRVFEEVGSRRPVAVSHFLFLLDDELLGKSNGLLRSGFPNIFHLADGGGVIRCVESRWHEDAPRWNVRAFSMDYPVECFPKGYVITYKNG